MTTDIIVRPPDGAMLRAKVAKFVLLVGAWAASLCLHGGVTYLAQMTCDASFGRKPPFWLLFATLLGLAWILKRRN